MSSYHNNFSNMSSDQSVDATTCANQHYLPLDNRMSQTTCPLNNAKRNSYKPD